MVKQSGARDRVLPPLDGGEVAAYIAIPAADVVQLAGMYIRAMEIEETDKWCRCEWITHPDDVEVVDNTCRVCTHKREHDIHNAEREPHYDHPYRGKRKRRNEQAPDCPVHTREGLVIYFLEWVFTGERN